MKLFVFILAIASLHAGAQLISPSVSSFNSRTGAVVPVANDYSFSQLSGSPTAAQIQGAGPLSNDTTGNAASATTASELNGASVPSSTAFLATNSSGQIVAATPFISPVVATGVSGTFSAQTFVLGGCTSTLTVTIAGATVGTNAATASPIFSSAPGVSIGAFNLQAWVSAANTVSVQGCAFTALGSLPSFQAKILMY